jgi:hypothetical protein
MKFKVIDKLPEKLRRPVARTGLKLRKYTPEIAFGAGVILSAAAVYYAWKVSDQIQDVMSEHDERMDQLHKLKEVAMDKDNPEYTKRMYKYDLLKGYAKSFGAFGRVYGPSTGLWFASMMSFGVSFGVLKRRNRELFLAYSAIEAGYSAYRGRVVKEFGEEVDYRLRHGLREETVEEVYVDDKGKEKTKKVTKTMVNEDDISEYAIIFNKQNCPTGWKNVPAYNRTFLENMQNYANDLLNTRGHLFLNEVYDMLGADRTPEGQIVGWFKSWDPADPDRDNFVDFGFMRDVLYDDKGLGRDGILLDFNVDGPIVDLI